MSETKQILGLDLGTNSIGWAVIKAKDNGDGIFQPEGIESAGSRIIPMDAGTLGKFNNGVSISSTAERTRLRGARRLIERRLLRRQRLHRVLDILGFLPLHYAQCLDRYGNILEGHEPKLAWAKNQAGKFQFLFQNSFEEMLEEFRRYQPEFLCQEGKIPYDWTIYYLRKKAITDKISKEELTWILLNFNQKRGCNLSRNEEKQSSEKVKEEYYALKVSDVSVEEDNISHKNYYVITFISVH